MTKHFRSPNWWATARENLPVWATERTYNLNFYEMPLTNYKGEGRYKVLILDTETTGLDKFGPTEVVEIGMIKAYVNTDGTIYHATPYIEQQYPQVEFQPEASKVNGLSKELLLGKEFNLKKIVKLIQWADYVVCHNSKFDRGQIAKIIPKSILDDTIWLCSWRDIPWLEYGAQREKLEMLCQMYDIGYHSHMGLSDCAAVGTLLQKRWQGETHFKRLLEHGNDPDELLIFIPPRRNYWEGLTEVRDLWGFKYESEFYIDIPEHNLGPDHIKANFKHIEREDAIDFYLNNKRKIVNLIKRPYHPWGLYFWTRPANMRHR